MNRAGNERTGNRMLNIPVKGGAELTEATMAAINSDGYAWIQIPRTGASYYLKSVSNPHRSTS